MTPTILFEDNHLLAVNKPPGLLAQGDSSGDASLIDWARAYRKESRGKPGNVYIGLVHRLDRPVSGVVVLALTSKAASRLSQQFRDGLVEKHYLAAVERLPDSPIDAGLDHGVWEDRLQKDRSANRSAAADDEDESGKLARTAWRRLERKDPLWLLELHPLTGRSHQLRVQTSSRGLIIVGDRKYGSQRKFADGIALHAARLRIEHPTKRETMEFAAPVPAAWRKLPFTTKELLSSLGDG